METPQKLTAKQLAADIYKLTRETRHPRRWASRRTVLDWIQRKGLPAERVTLESGASYFRIDPAEFLLWWDNRVDGRTERGARIKAENWAKKGQVQ